MITQADIDPLTQRIDLLESLCKQLAESLVGLSQKAGETAGRLDKITGNINKAELNYLKTMTEATNTDIKLHGGGK